MVNLTSKVLKKRDSRRENLARRGSQGRQTSRPKTKARNVRNAAEYMLVANVRRQAKMSVFEDRDVSKGRVCIKIVENL